MNGIIGMTELALETPLTGHQREYLTAVRDSADSLLTLLNDILDFSKMETEKLELETVAFDPHRVVERTVKTFDLRACEKGLNLHMAMDDDVPRALVGDPTRLRQVLVNLIDNAIRFTESGRVEVEVEVESSDESKLTLRFVVRDTGIGIPEDKRKAIFESFTQADGSTTRKYGGTGLGLTISSRLVEMMGGSIDLETDEGVGSVFSFTVEFGVSRDEVLTPEPGPSEGGHHTELPPLRVLVAEDNVVNRMLTVHILEQEGHAVEVAQTGLGVLETLGENCFDVILMDLEMPELGGVETTMRIRQKERQTGEHVPIVALTAHALPGDRKRSLDAGMDGYIAKPIRRGSLLNAIAEVVPSEVVERLGKTARRPAPAKRLVRRDSRRDLTRTFVDSTLNELRRIRRAIKKGQAEKVRVHAHAIAGAAAVLSAKRALVLARRIESIANEGKLSGAWDVCATLEQEVKRFDKANEGQ